MKSDGDEKEKDEFPEPEFMSGEDSDNEEEEGEEEEDEEEVLERLRCWDRTNGHYDGICSLMSAMFIALVIQGSRTLSSWVIPYSITMMISGHPDFELDILVQAGASVTFFFLPAEVDGVIGANSSWYERISPIPLLWEELWSCREAAMQMSRRVGSASVKIQCHEF